MNRHIAWFYVLLLVSIAAGCAAPSEPAAAGTSTVIPPTQTATAAPSPVPTATSTATPAPTPIRTPPALPPVFQTDLLNPLDTPHTYLEDTCQYLRDKWTPGKAAPGTVVMPVMFHSIVRGEASSANQISFAAFQRLMKDLHDQHFQAITAQQLADFMQHNAYIPPRSVILIVDDRHYRQYFDNFFKPYWDEWGWPVVNSWISHPDTLPQVWEENEALEAEGWVDHQAHGVIHNIPMSDASSDQYIYGELQGAIDAFAAHFGKKPIAIIWPGGGFGVRPVEIAHELGYQLGFTVNPRGPLLFNWVPQSDAKDPMRPSYIPEGAAGYPLLTLPRYWDTDASMHIDAVRQIGNAARDYALAHKDDELLYYEILCAPTYGPIPQETP